MRLLRWGQPGAEKPGLIDGEGIISLTRRHRNEQR